ncbi:Uncharacterized protein PBTT_07837 [Plasmodiophora brassicae]
MSGTLADLLARANPDGTINFSEYKQMMSQVQKRSLSTCANTPPGCALFCRTALDVIASNMAIAAQVGDPEFLSRTITIDSLNMIESIAEYADERAVLAMSLLIHASKATRFRQWKRFDDFIMVLHDHEEFRLASDDEKPSHDVEYVARSIVELGDRITAWILCTTRDRLQAIPTIYYVACSAAVRGWSTPIGIVINVVAVPRRRYHVLTHPIALACLIGHENAHYQLRLLSNDHNVSSPAKLPALNEAAGPAGWTQEQVHDALRFEAFKAGHIETGLMFEILFFGEKLNFIRCNLADQLLEDLNHRLQSLDPFPLLRNGDLVKYRRLTLPWNDEMAFEPDPWFQDLPFE